MRDTTIWIMSSKTLEDLPAAETQMIRDAASEALAWGNDYLAKTEGDIIEGLKQKGVVITELSDEVKGEFQEQCKGIYTEFEPTIGKNVIELFTKGYLED